jgi:protein-S-isoprenylcysteine O-methyltransferase Ste14
MVLTFVGLLSRIGTEDEALRRVFGAEWEKWAGRVRYKLVPWVY